MESPCDRISSPRWRDQFRADRLATLYLSYPFRRVMESRRGVPILMYHSVSDVSEGHRHPYFETATSPAVFAEQMKFLKDHGYRTITLDEAVRYIGSGMQDDQGRVVITFDDGFQDFYTQAFPILEEHQFTATVFLPTRYIADERRRFRNQNCLTWAEVRELRRADVTFGSHTATHQQLKFMKPVEVEQEIRSSKETIENQLGLSVDSFSYPFAFPEADGDFKRQLKDLLAAEGYKNGVTTVIGTLGANTDQFFQPRLPVNEFDDLLFFKAKLDRCYDWLHGLQYLSKLWAMRKEL